MAWLWAANESGPHGKVLPCIIDYRVSSKIWEAEIVLINKMIAIINKIISKEKSKKNK